MNRAVRKAAGLAARLCTGCMILSTALAEEFSWQVSADYRGGDAGAAQTQHRLLRTTYYLSPVDDSAGPHELAPFLNRSSYLTAGASRTKLREDAYLYFGTRPIAGNDTLTGNAVGVWGTGALNGAARAFTSESGIDASDYDVGGRYVWPGSSGWYAGVRARRGGGDALPHPLSLRTTAEFTHTGLFAGRYFGTRTAVELDIGSGTMNREEYAELFPDPLFRLPGPAGLPGILGGASAGVTREETDNARLSVRHVGDLGDSTFEFSAGVRASRSDTRVTVPLTSGFFSRSNPFDPPFVDPYGNLIGVVGEPVIESGWSEREREVRLSGALFPDEALGVRLTLSTSDHDARGTADRVALSAQWFFVPSAAVGVELARGHSGCSGRGCIADTRDADSAGVRLLGRF